MIDIGEAMETKTKQIDAQKVPQKNGSGSLLAEARKKQKKTVEEIADELNLSVTQIKTIELDQNEGLPEPTYVRGYIRSYAKLLGLDAERVLASYLNPNWQKTSSLDDMPKGIGNADEGGGSTFLSPGKLIFALFVILIAAFLWFSGFLSSFIAPNTSPVRNEPVQVTSQVLPNDNHIEQTPSTPEPVSNIVNETDQEPENEILPETLISNIQPLAEEEVESSPVVSNLLTLMFVQDCWVDIRDNNDKRLAYKSYSAGEELSVPNKGRLNVFLGNAEGVTATYNGEPFDMTSYREGVYAKFSLIKK